MYKHINREKGLWRSWFRFWGIKLSLEIAYGRKRKNYGFRFHLGNKSSETPLDIMLGLGLIAFYWSIDFKNLGAICQWIGRGHKRDISLRFFGGHMWWKLWFDDDMGYDPYHRCDGWRTPPKLWPFKNNKYRSWMCLRNGSISLNPLNELWGERSYHYEDLAVEKTTWGAYQWDTDVYDVEFTLQKMTRYRENGPQWARKCTDEGYIVEWRCKEGIPFRNHDWKGDCYYGSSFKIDGDEGWLGKAEVALLAEVLEDREHYDYRHPGLSENPIYDYMAKEGVFAAVPQDEMKVSDMVNESEQLKSLYTPEELHTQAINRDNQED